MIQETNIIPEYLINVMTQVSLKTLFYENRFATDFTKKVELFSSFFAKQCTVLNNGCK